MVIWRGCFGMSEIKNYQQFSYVDALFRKKLGTCGNHHCFARIVVTYFWENPMRTYRIWGMTVQILETWAALGEAPLLLAKSWRDSNGFNVWKTRHGAWKLRERRMKLIWDVEVSNPWVTQIIQSSWMTMFHSDDFLWLYPGGYRVILCICWSIGSSAEMAQLDGQK